MKILNIIIAVIGILVFGLIFLGRKTMMGEKYKVSEIESVNYSKKATLEDAKKLAEVLKADGIFSGKRPADVLLMKDDKDGVVVSFVGSWNTKDEGVIRDFKQIGQDVSAGGFGKPVTIRLLDKKLNTTGEFKVE